MTKMILRVQNIMRSDDFNKLKEEWERDNPETLVIPYTMRVERSKARWIYREDKNRSGGKFECSICRHGWGDEYNIDLFNYCPNCGSEMEER